MAIYMLLTLGTTVIGGPLIGWICQHWSPQTGLEVAGLATLSTVGAPVAPAHRSVANTEARNASPGFAAGCFASSGAERRLSRPLSGVSTAAGSCSIMIS